MYKIEITDLETGKKLDDTEAEAIVVGFGGINKEERRSDGKAHIEGKVATYANCNSEVLALIMARMQEMFNKWCLKDENLLKAFLGNIALKETDEVLQ